MTARLMILAMSVILATTTIAPAQQPAPYLQMEMIPPVVPYAKVESGIQPASCSNCGPTVAASAAGRASLLGGLRIGCGCASEAGCGNFQSVKTFIFGSCRQFYNAGNQCGRGFGLNGCCGFPGYDPCSKGGNSYLNR